MLTSYDGNTITYDTIGNPLTDGTWTYTWQHGRQLASMTDGTTTWSYTYNADGLRTERTDGTDTYEYVYNGSQLVQMIAGTDVLYFAYDASGTPMAVTYNGVTYYYVTNLQGDVIAITDNAGYTVATYDYDAWGNAIITEDTVTSTIGNLNPLRYRGYVWDSDTQFYYLQSRYYDPEVGRFLNADAYATTGQGLIGNNMFAYCLNNPVRYRDLSGYACIEAILSYLSSVLPYVISGAIAGAVVGVISYCLNIGINNAAFVWSDFWDVVGTGALTGGIGGLAGPAGTTGKIVISAGVGVIAGVKSGMDTDGELKDKITAGAITFVHTGLANYAGAVIDPQVSSAVAKGFVNFAGTLFTGTPAEFLNAANQKIAVYIMDLTEDFISFITTPSVTTDPLLYWGGDQTARMLRY